MAHVEHAAAGFADHGKGFDQEVVERGALSDSLFEFNSFSGQVDVGEFAKLGFQGADGRHRGQHALHFTFVFGSEDFGQNGINACIGLVTDENLQILFYSVKRDVR